MTVRWSVLRWYYAPLYLIALPFLAVGWLLKEFVDAAFDLYEALTGRQA